MTNGVALNGHVISALLPRSTPAPSPPPPPSCPLPSTPLSPPSITFPFPYTPYPVQQQLMEVIYDTIDRVPSSPPPPQPSSPTSHYPTSSPSLSPHWANVGLLESPTGTGKSLSLICASLHWLLDHSHDNPLTSSPTTSPSPPEVESNPSWVSAFFDDQAKKEREEAERLLQQKKAELLQAHPPPSSTPFDRRRGVHRKADDRHLSSSIAGEDDDDLIADWDDDEGHSTVLPLWKRLLLEDERAKSSAVEAAQAEAKERSMVAHLLVHPQLILCSRTHSQLNQLVGEIQRTVWRDRVRVVSLGSRQQLCQHEGVKALHSGVRMSDACVDMQKGKEKKGKRVKSPHTPTSLSSPCPYLDQSLLSSYRDHVHTAVRDMEGLYALGRRLSCCAYYGTRAAIPTVHVLTMPYQSLLHRGSREALGVGDEVLKGSVIVLDEAHNLIESIVGMHSVTLTLQVMTRGIVVLNGYEERYRMRLKPSNLQLIQQLQFIINKLIAFLNRQGQQDRAGIGTQPPVEIGSTVDVGVSSGGRAGNGSGGGKGGGVGGCRVLSINDFLVECGIDHLNLFKLCRFVTDSQLPKKLNGFLDRTDPPSVVIHRPPNEGQGGSGNVMHLLEAFLSSLCHCNQDGRIVVQWTQETGVVGMGSSIRFLLLNPSVPFLPLLQHARAVLLLGGTLQPFSLIQQQLLPTLPAHHLRTFSCAHVIPPSHLLCLVVGSGPTGYPLIVNHDSRGDVQLLEEVSRVVLNLIQAVPDGLVLFVPSYALLKTLVGHWRAGGWWDRYEKVKEVMVDSPEVKVEGMMAGYHKAIHQGRGAMLCSVVGGRLSEGINFSDRLCRGVGLIGLPYANPFDMEVKAKREWIEGVGGGGVLGGKEWYEAMCMRGVNQSVGRSIRHVKDYAAIVLIDGRYGRPGVQAGMAGWVRERTVVVERFGEAVRRLREFFKEKEGKKGVNH